MLCTQVCASFPLSILGDGGRKSCGQDGTAPYGDYCESHRHTHTRTHTKGNPANARYLQPTIAAIAVLLQISRQATDGLLPRKGWEIVELAKKKGGLGTAPFFGVRHCHRRAAVAWLEKQETTRKNVTCRGHLCVRIPVRRFNGMLLVLQRRSMTLEACARSSFVEEKKKRKG